MEARWTPAEAAGSMLFSTNRRDRSSYEDADWAKRDRPWWILHEGIARVLLDDFDLHETVAAIVMVTSVCIVMYLLREMIKFVVDEYLWWRSDAATRQLIRQEMATVQVEKSATVSATVQVAEVSDRRSRRYCRFCDVPIEDAFTTAHEAGKKHKRLVTAAGALAFSSYSCWVWRQEAESARTEAVAPVPRDDSRGQQIAASFTSAGMGKGAWTAAPQSKKRR